MQIFGRGLPRQIFRAYPSACPGDRVRAATRCLRTDRHGIGLPRVVIMGEVEGFLRVCLNRASGAGLGYMGQSRD